MMYQSADYRTCQFFIIKYAIPFAEFQICCNDYSFETKRVLFFRGARNEVFHFMQGFLSFGTLDSQCTKSKMIMGRIYVNARVSNRDQYLDG